MYVEGTLGVVSRHADVFHKMFSSVQGEGGIEKSAPNIYNNVK